jgi:hypothetical protein
VYNDSDDDIVIPRVGLRLGEQSKYRLAVDGVPGQTFEDVQLLANDSLFVFVETTIDITEFSDGDEFLYTDAIDFGDNSTIQTVDLVTLVKDAIFLFPERDGTGMEESLLLDVDEDGNELRIRGFFLDDDELTFTNEKPYVIYGFAAIPPDRTATIDAGARLFFHDQSGLIAASDASLKVNGELSTTEALENEVVFQGDRLEPRFSDVAGQWAAIWLTAGSKNHEISHATIKNASVGIIMDSQNPESDGATLKIDDTQIYNSANSGIIATTANIEASNLVINNSGQSSLVLRLGGTYSFNNSTITNYFNAGPRRDPALFISNTIPNTGLTAPLESALFTNCIIYGDRDVELALLDDDQSSFNFQFENSLIRFEDRFNDFEDLAAYDFNNSELYNDIVLNADPVFEDEDNNNLQIDNSSGANAIASPDTATDVDIQGKTRSQMPDAGAYESIQLEQ